MNPKLIALTVTAMTVALLAVGAAQAQACSCAGPAVGQEREFYLEKLKRSDGAVVVKVLNVKRIEITDGDFTRFDARYTLRVRRAFKRFGQFPRGRVLRITTSADGATCGLGLGVGRVQGLFLYRYRGRLTSSLCSQVSRRDLRRAARDRAKGAAEGPTLVSGPSGCAAPSHAA